MSDTFAERFGAWWAAPDPATLGTILGPEVVLRQPLTPTTRGLPAAQASFESLLALMPDLMATVERSAATPEGALIEFTVSGSFGGRPLSWRAVDSFVLGDDGLALERVAYFDGLALAVKFLARPRGWPALWRMALRLARSGIIRG